MKQLKKLYISLLILSGFIILPAMGRAQNVDKEAKLKAVFLYNFTKYIDWPTMYNSPYFTIGVVGSSDIIDPLNQIAKTNSVGGKKIVVLNLKRGQEIPRCDVLFISRSMENSISSVISQTGKGTLTVSDGYAFNSSGAALNFVLKDDKLKFEASLKAINLTGLKISAQLLKLAILVD